MLLHSVQALGVFDVHIIFDVCVTLISKVWKKCGEKQINQRIMQIDRNYLMIHSCLKPHFYVLILVRIGIGCKAANWDTTLNAYIVHRVALYIS